MNREIEIWKTKQGQRFKNAEGEFYPPPVRHMLAYYGRAEGTCEKCIFLQAFKEGPKKYVYHCVKYNRSKGVWKKDHPACGLKEEIMHE